MNKKITFLMLAFLATMWNATIAQKTYDFKVGKLYYTILDADKKYVEVTGELSKPAYYSSEDNKPSGDIVIPDSVTNEGKKYHVVYVAPSAFMTCQKITSITYPDNIQILTNGGLMLDNCQALKAVYVSAKNRRFSSVDGVLYNKDTTALIFCPPAKAGELMIPPKTERLNIMFSFSICPLITAFKVHSANQYFKDIDGVLFNKNGTYLLYYPLAKSSKSYIVSAGVTNISWRAFGNCINLEKITLPADIKEIGWNAFFGCKNLKHITVSWDEPMAIDANVFQAVPFSEITLTVPKGKKSAYQAAPVWKDFKYVSEVANEQIDDDTHVWASEGRLYVDSPSAETVEVYTFGGTMLFRTVKPAGQAVYDPSLATGIYIIRIGDKVSKIAI